MRLKMADITKDDSRKIESEEDYTEEELKEFLDKQFDEAR